MNHYMEMQLANMSCFVKTFEQSCHMAAKRDDGHISKEEQKILKKIAAANLTYLKALDKIRQM